MIYVIYRRRAQKAKALTLVEGCADGAFENEGDSLGCIDGIVEELGIMLGVLDGYTIDKYHMNVEVYSA
eukprot:scaffold31775_cov79-Cyclotella_meneghiniana.AAC.8